MKRVFIISDFILGSGLTQYSLNIMNSGKFKNTEFIPVSISGRQDMLDKLYPLRESYCISAVNKSVFKHITDWWNVSKKFKGTNTVVYFNISATWNFLPVLLIHLRGVSNIIIHAHSDYYSKIPRTKVGLLFLNCLNVLGRKVFFDFGQYHFACSEKAAKWVFPIKANENNQVKILKNAIQTEKFQYNEKSRQKKRTLLELEKTDIVIGHVGGYMIRKNQELLIKTVACLIEENIPVKLVLIGDGALKEHYEQLIDDLHIEDSVFLIPTNNEINEWYNAMDIFAFPSITEGLGMAFVEAQTNGLTSVISPSIVEEAVCLNNVYVAEDFSIANWVRKFKMVINKGFTREKNSREKVIKSGYDLSTLLEFYKSMGW